MINRNYSKLKYSRLTLWVLRRVCGLCPIQTLCVFSTQ